MRWLIIRPMQYILISQERIESLVLGRQLEWRIWLWSRKRELKARNMIPNYGIRPPLISQERIESLEFLSQFQTYCPSLISQERIESSLFFKTIQGYTFFPDLARENWKTIDDRDYSFIELGLISQERIERRIRNTALYSVQSSWSRKRELKGFLENR